MITITVCYDQCNTVKSIIRSCSHTPSQNSISSSVTRTFTDVVSCLRVQDLNKASCCSVFATRWISSLRPETSRWSEERNRRGREAKRRSPRLHAGRRKVQCELYEFAHVTELTWKLDGWLDFVCLPLKSPRNAHLPMTRRTTKLWRWWRDRESTGPSRRTPWWCSAMWPHTCSTARYAHSRAA